ncbi:MAG TPA: aminodeoxychorismate/anthranilate synthase component II [Prolixibacteraceae bacterium]|nr:aminodeoxychorismate/anthranilate synthase component II [Prolixibacteraceae bacterium]
MRQFENEMKILVLDNYDSFTWNLVHAVRKISGPEVAVVRNDEVDLDSIEEYDKIMLSPGPGIPSEAGVMMELIARYAPVKSILGVCLGHQAIGEVFGARLLNMDRVIHGMATPVHVISRQTSLFNDIPDTFDAGRYHSWIIADKEFPSCLEITGKDSNNQIMSIRHREFDVQGVQFHPESVLTPRGEQMIANWLKN